MPEKPHRPEPLTRNDPYPPAEERDPMAERRRNSAGFYAGVEEAIAARPAQPSYITRTEGDDEAGYTITLDDGLGTVIKVEPGDDGLGRVLEVTSLGDTVRVDLKGSLDRVLYEVLRASLRLTPDNAAPITGSR